MKAITRPPPTKNPHAVALGRKGGLATTAAKIAAAQANGKKGGRRKTLPAALALLLLASVALTACDGVKQLPGSPSAVTSASNLTFTVQPSALLLSGSTVTITARVRDDKGTNAVGSQVTFTTSAGTLNHTIVTTDGTGFATVELTAGEAASVTATTANTAGTVAIPAAAPYSVTIAPQGAVTVNQAATLLVTVTPNRMIVSPPSPDSVSVSCGPGLPLVAMSGAGRTCTFPTVGSTVVSVSAPSANGWTANSTAAVQVNAVVVAPTVPVPPVADPIPPTLSAVIGCTPATGSLFLPCNVQSVSYGATAINVHDVTEVNWTWGDNSGGDRSASVARTHQYLQTGTYQLRVTVTAPTADGPKETTVAMAVTVPKP
jgi:hypothetical protein